MAPTEHSDSEMESSLNPYESSLDEMETSFGTMGLTDMPHFKGKYGININLRDPKPILAFLKEHNIPYTYVIINMVPTGNSKKPFNKEFINPTELNLTLPWVFPSSKNWENGKNTIVRRTCEDHLQKWKNACDAQGYDLMIAYDTKHAPTLDIDNDRIFQTCPPLLPILMQLPVYLSSSKRLLKVFLPLNKMPPELVNANTKFLNGDFEIQFANQADASKGRWTYVRPDEMVYQPNTHQNDTVNLEPLISVIDKTSSSRSVSRNARLSNRQPELELEEHECPYKHLTKQDLEDKLAELRHFDDEQQQLDLEYVPFGSTYEDYRNLGTAIKHFVFYTIMDEQTGYEMWHSFMSVCPKYHEGEWGEWEANSKSMRDWFYFDINSLCFSFLANKLNQYGRQQPFLEETLDTNQLREILESLNPQRFLDKTFIDAVRKTIKRYRQVGGYTVFKTLLTPFVHYSDIEWGSQQKAYTRDTPRRKDCMTTFKNFLYSDNLIKFREMFMVGQENRSYEDVKEEFEKKCVKIVNAVKYLYIDPNDRYLLKTPRDTIDMFAHITYVEFNERTGEMEVKPFIKKWMSDPNIRRVDDLKFSLEHGAEFMDNNMTVINLFRGLNGAQFPNPENSEEIVEEILEYIKAQLCDGDADYAVYFVKWMASIVQKPWIKTGICQILKGIQGNGKSSFIDFFGKQILGEKYYLNFSDTKFLDSWNQDVETALLIQLDEIDHKDLTGKGGKFKNAITEPRLKIYQKNVDSRQTENYNNFVICTNNPLPAVIEFGDRRFCGIDSKAPKLTPELEERFPAGLINRIHPHEEAIGAFYHFLKEMDLSDFHLQNSRVMTNLYKDCQAVAVPDTIRFLFWYCHEYMDRQDEAFEENGLVASVWYDHYKIYKQRMGEHVRIMSQPSFSALWKKDLVEGRDYHVRKATCKQPNGKKTSHITTQLVREAMDVVFLKYRLLDVDIEELDFEGDDATNFLERQGVFGNNHRDMNR